MNTGFGMTAVVSGGMDSTALAYALRDQRPDDPMLVVSFNYGQRHAKELTFAAITAADLDAEHQIVDLSGLYLPGSSLTDSTVDVPDGHYAKDTMKATVVANRNAIMLNIATGLAISRGHDLVALGVHSGDHFIYPDCRPEFVDAARQAILVGNEGFLADGFDVIAPFMHKTKADIASIGEAVGVPWDNTWSCYKGGDVHCGRCGTCVERQEAFHEANVFDPTDYADPDFWEKAVEDAKVTG